MVRTESDSERRAERDREPAVACPGGNATRYGENGYSVVGWPINPGLYAGRIGDRVKIGQSMNVAAAR
jgi:hypothetical protein